MDAKGENKGAGGDIPLAADLIDDYAEISKQMQKIDQILGPLQSSYTKSISAVDDLGQLSHLLKGVADSVGEQSSGSAVDGSGGKDKR